MGTLNPIVMVASGALVMFVVYAFISSTKKGFLVRRRGYELERVDAINTVEDLEALLGEDLTHPEPTGILTVLPDSSDRYVRKSDQEILSLYGEGPFSRVMVKLNSHLEKSHNVLVPWEYALLLAIGFVGGGALGFYLVPAWWFALILAVIGSFTVAEKVLSSQARDYRETVNKQAIGLVQLVIQGLRANYTLPQAFEESSKDLGDPMAHELEGLLRSVRGQVAFATACRQAVPLSSSSFLKKIFKVIIMCEESDMETEQVAERLTVIRKNLLVEYSLKLSMKAQSAGGAMARNFLVWIVPGLLFFVIKQAPSTLKPLIEGPAGWAVIAVGLVLFFSGVFLSKKVLEDLEV